MSLMLPVQGQKLPPQIAWERFRARRESLEAQMALEVCDGCDSCGSRCTAGFLVTRQEWEAAKEFVATLPAAEVRRVAALEKTVPWPEGDVSGPMVTYCRYRDRESGGCLIYPARPTICRLFGHTHWLPCPIDAVPETPEEAVSVWNEYRHFTRRTWEEWEQEDLGWSLEK